MVAVAKSVETVPVTGLAATYHDADAEGQKCDISSGHVVLHVKNASGETLTITIKGGMGLGGRYYADRNPDTIADGEAAFVGFQKTDDRGSDDAGKTEWSWSVTSGVTFAVLKTS